MTHFSRYCSSDDTKEARALRSYSSMQQARGGVVHFQMPKSALRTKYVRPRQSVPPRTSVWLAAVHGVVEPQIGSKLIDIKANQLRVILYNCINVQRNQSYMYALVHLI